MKPEDINDTILRISKEEVGIEIVPINNKFIGQYVGRFKVENNRQDLSTCYELRYNSPTLKINKSHFNGHRFIESKEDMPERIGGMYRYFLNAFFLQNSIKSNQNKEDLA